MLKVTNVVDRRFPAVHGSYRERLLCGKQALGVRNELHAHFGLDENHMVYAGIALGWPDPDEGYQSSERLQGR